MNKVIIGLEEVLQAGRNEKTGVYKVTYRLLDLQCVTYMMLNYSNDK